MKLLRTLLSTRAAGVLLVGTSLASAAAIFVSALLAAGDTGCAALNSDAYACTTAAAAHAAGGDAAPFLYSQTGDGGDAVSGTAAANSTSPSPDAQMVGVGASSLQLETVGLTSNPDGGSYLMFALQVESGQTGADTPLSLTSLELHTSEMGTFRGYDGSATSAPATLAAWGFGPNESIVFDGSRDAYLYVPLSVLGATPATYFDYSYRLAPAAAPASAAGAPDGTPLTCGDCAQSLTQGPTYELRDVSATSVAAAVPLPMPLALLGAGLAALGLLGIRSRRG